MLPERSGGPRLRTLHWGSCLRLGCCSITQWCLTLWPHGPQHSRLPSPSLSPRVSQTHVHWVGDAIQLSRPVSHFSSCLQSSQPQSCFWKHKGTGWQEWWYLGPCDARPLEVLGWYWLQLVFHWLLLSKPLVPRTLKRVHCQVQWMLELLHPINPMCPVSSLRQVLLLKEAWNDLFSSKQCISFSR